MTASLASPPSATNWPEYSLSKGRLNKLSLFIRKRWQSRTRIKLNSICSATSWRTTISRTTCGCWEIPAAADYARAGLHLAQEKVSLTHQPYLYSTLGEIALAQDDLETAERYFTEGLALAERLTSSERIAGLTANLGLVARARGEVAVATSRFLRALADAESLQLNQMAVEIRLWLVPLVTRREAQHYLREARVIAERGGYQRELQTIAQLELQVQPFDF